MNVDSWSYFRNRSETHEETLLYGCLQRWIDQEPPDFAIDRFHRLFIEGVPYADDRPAFWALSQLMRSPESLMFFKYIINRCFYTLINPWQIEQQNGAIVKLIATLDRPPSRDINSATAEDLRELVRQFRNTEQHKALCHLKQVLQEPQDVPDPRIGSLLRRYPCLYQHCLLTRDIEEEQRENIWRMRDRVQQQFDRDLARYQAYWESSSALPRLQPVNPTVLSIPELNEALNYYMKQRNRYRRDAEQLRESGKQMRFYQEFKEELVNYLIQPLVDAAEINMPTQRSARWFVDSHFNQKLQQYLNGLLVDSNSQRLHDPLLVETCRQLLNFLVVESPENPAHHNFYQLVSSVGYTLTIGLLLRLVYLCRTVKPWLEKRFAILFNQWEAKPKSEGSWVVDALEHLNIALITNFDGRSFRTAVA